ncbi:MAG TPA: ABC transporter permease subunit [Candidatus Limnocylindrales bacterium]
MTPAAVRPLGASTRVVRRSASRPGLSPRARALAVTGVVATFFVLWEVLKWLAGDPWRIHGSLLGVRVDYEHLPPFALSIAGDLALPHVWSIVGAFFEPAQRYGPPVWEVLIGASLYTFREAFVGFVLGAVLGLALGIVFVRVRLLERAFVPYVVASQTIPLITIAPIVVIYLGASWTSVAMIAAYLTFFPVTVAALRGLRAADPRAFELLRSAAASETQVFWKLRLPASVPYLFSALRISASASVVGAIIGELPSGIPDGLGGQILQDVQYYITGPERLWATLVAAALLGILFVGLVRVAETVLTTGRYRPANA